MDIFKTKNFRVHSISILGEEDPPVSYGLSIETQNSNGSYCVVAFVRYDKDEGITYYEPVGKRIEDTTPTWELVKEFRACLKVAYALVEASNEGAEEYD